MLKISLLANVGRFTVVLINVQYPFKETYIHCENMAVVFLCLWSLF